MQSSMEMPLSQEVNLQQQISQENHIQKNIENFQELKNFLDKNGFRSATQEELFTITNNYTLLCRSHHFSDIQLLLEIGRPIKLQSFDGANMCRMSRGQGIRIAMEEGFAKDVRSGIKTVIVFEKSHLSSLQETLKKDDSLWLTKPKTAQVSAIGEGSIFPEDIRLLVFRIHKNLLNKSLRDDLDDEGKTFLFRSFTKKVVHYIEHTTIILLIHISTISLI